MNECALAVGVDIMKPGPLGVADASKIGKKKKVKKKEPKKTILGAMMTKFPLAKAPLNPQMFGNAGREHMAKYGSEPRHFAAIGEKNHRHSTNNPYSQFRDVYSLEQIQNSRMIYPPLTLLQCSPTSDGAAAAILCSEDFVKKHGLEGNAIEIIGQVMKTDLPSAVVGNTERTCINAVGYDMAAAAAKDIYSQTKLGPQDVDVIELHDCFSCNELITYEALGLSKEEKVTNLSTEATTHLVENGWSILLVG
eukprot:TRINITY_DN4688_c0_g1_i1.p1 TRINITY_DN4688_c0_g1~~TRINITY_DN4688_c0_g1_i1.p1  ORF type:complete len:276 (-),score=47.66 TRINITY_DN4688_c0_g1_i1:142-894(-)